MEISVIQNNFKIKSEMLAIFLETGLNKNKWGEFYDLNSKTPPVIASSWSRCLIRTKVT